MIQRKPGKTYKSLKQKTPLKRGPIKPPSYEEALAKAQEANKRLQKAKPQKDKVKKARASTRKPTVAKLKKKADTAFSMYIRLRDAEFKGGNWWCQCITCGAWKPIKEIQNGHFQSRRYMSTRYHEQNCHSQCAKCNIFNQGEQYKYSLAVDKKYGPGTARKLELLAQQVKQFKTWELEEMIDEYQAKIKEYEEKHLHG